MGKAFKDYLKEKPNDEEVESAFLEMLKDGPRGCILSASSFIEDVLRGAVAHRFGHLREVELKELFSGFGPLSSFSSMIKVGYAMGVIGPKSRHDLEVLRELRNAAAHTTRMLSFEMLEIIDLVASLHALKDVTAPSPTIQISFVQATRLLMLHLVAKMHSPPLKVGGIDHLD